MTALPKSEFLASLDRISTELEHGRNLAGKTTTKCAKCKGTGVESPGYDAWDGNGRFYVSASPCRPCDGRGRVEVECSPQAEAAAIEREITSLKVRLRDARKRCAKKAEAP